MIDDVKTLRIIADYTYHWEFWRDPAGKLVWVSQACEAVTGYTTQEYVFCSQSLLECIMAQRSRDTWLKHEEFIRNNHEAHCEIELLVRKKNGEEAWILHTCRPIYDQRGVYLGRRGCNVDITYRKRMEQALVRSESILRTTIDSIFDGIVVANRSLHIEQVNCQIYSMFNISKDYVGSSVWSFFEAICSCASNSNCAVKLSPSNGDIFSLNDYVFLTKHGKYFAVNSRKTVDELNYTGWIWSFRDVTTIKLHEEKLNTLARTDPLTGVGNRREFCNRGQREFERCKRYGTPLSLLVLDIDRFKSINDRFGHDAGDMVLVAVAKVCEDLLRGSDLFCRIGGEEFAALLVQTDATQGLFTASRLHKAIAELSVANGNSTIHTTVSIGVASVDLGHDSIESVLKDADRALYEAKAQGRNRVCSSCRDEPESPR
ncbi:hypothetical protein JCM15519_24670 [Fundidesulfovibrio butyratiphilus]